MDDGLAVAPRNIDWSLSDMETQDDKRQMLDEMQRHAAGIDVRPDSTAGHMYSCVANGKLYCEHDMAILALVLNGADITEVITTDSW